MPKQRKAENKKATEEDFRKSFKENYPDNKSIAVVGKAGGEKWKSMADAEKAPYIKKAGKMMAEYEIALDAHKKKLDGYGVDVPVDSGKSFSEVESGKSSSEIYDDAEHEVSSQRN